MKSGVCRSSVELSPLPVWICNTHQSEENRLQDLLEAKALALSQADRLIAQYRFQRAQAEAEVTLTYSGQIIWLERFKTTVDLFYWASVQACKLGSLLKEAERRREDLQVELSSQVQEVERSRADMEELLQHNARLQQDSEEHQALKGAYNTLLNRSEAVTRRRERQIVGSMDVQCVTCRLPEQVQRERTAAEGAAGSSRLAQQTERLSEEEPRGSAAAAREVHLSVFISASACSHQHIRQSAAASVLNRMVSVLEEREQEIRCLQSDLQQKNSDITGRCDIIPSQLTHTQSLAPQVDLDSQHSALLCMLSIRSAW